MKVIAATDVAFKRYDLSVQGPVNQVKRAMLMVHRMDRPRRQVRINVKMSEMTSNAARTLGINWDGFSTVNFTELPKVTSGTFTGNPQLQFGAFAHSAASVNLQLQAARPAAKSRPWPTRPC
jgi:type II secretory pathway component GspD/PulD (secretin)